MMVRQVCYAAVVAVLGLGFSMSIPVASAQAAAAATKPDVSKFVGRWQMNVGKTKMGRMGPTGQNIVRDPTFTWIFTPQGEGLKMDVYTKYPQPAPTRTMTLIADGKERGCDSKNETACLTRGGDSAEQTYVYHYIDPHVVVRVFYIKGEVYEYSHYSVSTDGKTFSVVSWDPKTPEYHNIQVFDRQP